MLLMPGDNSELLSSAVGDSHVSVLAGSMYQKAVMPLTLLYGWYSMVDAELKYEVPGHPRHHPGHPKHHPGHLRHHPGHLRHHPRHHTRPAISLGRGKHVHMISAPNISALIGPEKSVTLSMFHAMRGCDTNTCSAGSRDKRARNARSMCPEITSVFVKLMDRQQLPEVDAAMDAVERFIALVCD